MADQQMQGESVEDAVLVMPDIPMDDYPKAEAAPVEKRDATEREPNGQFKTKEVIPGDNAKAAEAAADDDDDWIEEPGEEEGKPNRYRLTEVLDGYKRSKDLETEITKARAQPTFSPEFEAELAETVRTRSTYMDGLKRMHAMQQAPEPDLDLVNPSSTKYDPDAYHQSVLAYRQAHQTRAEIEAHYTEIANRQTQEQEAISRAKWSREQAKLKAIWPEVLANGPAQTKAREALAKHYGIDDAFLQSDLTLDSRIYALAKDALAYRESQAKTAEAVKIVRAKPKVVKGSARQSQTSQQRSSADGMKRLSQSGSLEDAADALSGLLN